MMQMVFADDLVFWIETNYPVRGRKQDCDCVCIFRRMCMDWNKLPRKGTETEEISIHRIPVTVRIETNYPVRGRKLEEEISIRRIPVTDWNKLPRKGTETQSGRSCRSFFAARIETNYPVRGRKPIWMTSCCMNILLWIETNYPVRGRKLLKCVNDMPYTFT